MFTTFGKFNNIEAALAVSELLTSHHIEYETSDNSGVFDPTMAHNETGKEYYINIQPADFEKANKLLLLETAKNLDKVGTDYFLYDFTDKELMEVVVKPEEWTQLDFLLAQKILKERGKEVEPLLMEVMQEEKNKQVFFPEKSAKTWIVAGYLFAFLGGPIGVLIGFHLMTYKKTLPGGQEIYAFVPKDRLHGRAILFIGLFMLAVILYARILGNV